MWFFKQAQQVSKSTEHRDEVSRKSFQSQFVDQKAEYMEERTGDSFQSQYSGHGVGHGETASKKQNGYVARVADGAGAAEGRVWEDVVNANLVNPVRASASGDWFVDVVKPIKSGSEKSEKSIEQLMDENGWWKEE